MRSEKQEAIKNKGGRPRKYTNVETLEQKINEYFDKCDKEHRPYTITGLALELDLDRKALLEYGTHEEFSYAIKKAKAKVERYAEESLYRSTQTAGVIFNLKNNFGWVDKQEINADVKQEATISITLED